MTFRHLSALAALRRHAEANASRQTRISQPITTNAKNQCHVEVTFGMRQEIRLQQHKLICSRWRIKHISATTCADSSHECGIAPYGRYRCLDRLAQVAAEANERAQPCALAKSGQCQSDARGDHKMRSCGRVLASTRLHNRNLVTIYGRPPAKIYLAGADGRELVVLPPVRQPGALR